MKRTSVSLVLIAVFISIGSLGGYFWWKKNSGPATSEEIKTRFVIPKGWAASRIGSSLYEKGLIKNPLAFKIYVQVTDKTKKLMPGEFTLSPNMNLAGIVDKLLQGPDELWITIPEGLRREEVVEKFIEGLGMTGNGAVNFRAEFLQSTQRDEGYLFPDTYLFPKDATAEMVSTRMKLVFDQKVDVEIKQKVAEGKYTLDQVIILASIIERETKTGDERPIVAGILYNRLENDWPLQADATVQYAVGGGRCAASSGQCSWWPVPTKDDLEINSPYNTYKFIGLPPAPIASPGLFSIKAAVYPEKSDYWYYIHDPEGQIHFAEDLEGHNRNIRVYLGR